MNASNVFVALTNLPRACKPVTSVARILPSTITERMKLAPHPSHTVCPAAPHTDNDQSCALLQSAEASAALQTFYDRQLASCEVQGPRAGHGPYHGLVQHFKPKMGANKKSAGVCCSLQHFANDHGSLVYSGTFSFPASCFLERVGKFSVSPLS